MRKGLFKRQRQSIARISFLAVSKIKPKPRARFRREAPEDRRRQLGEAALRCIVKHGNAGVSVRQIAAEAGVTQGLITHHFGEINELVAYAFDIMSAGLLQAILKAVEEAEPTPQARLDAFIEASFSPLLFDRDVLGVWVVFWGLILHSPRMSASQQQEYGDYVETVEGLIADLAAAENFEVGDVRLTAKAFTALMDGLWLAWCLNPNAFRPGDGAQLCRNWIEGLRRGAYA
jgi:AcrR family transcriptional regulator